MIAIMQVPDSISIAQNSVEKIVLMANNGVWVWIAIFEAICIIILLAILFGHRNKYSQAQQQFKADAQKVEIDFNNVIASSFHAGDLYNRLKKVCHPDRFSSNPELMSKADFLFQQITQNRHDLKRLQELKTEAMKELHINI